MCACAGVACMQSNYQHKMLKRQTNVATSMQIHTHTRIRTHAYKKLNCRDLIAGEQKKQKNQKICVLNGSKAIKNDKKWKNHCKRRRQKDQLLQVAIKSLEGRTWTLL